VNYTRALELVRLIENDSRNEGAVLIHARALRRELESAIAADPSVHDYQVTWMIDLDAETPEDAARKALAIQRDPTSTATIFHVRRAESASPNEEWQTIDILADERAASPRAEQP
jgi:hypothetical protein